MTPGAGRNGGAAAARSPIPRLWNGLVDGLAAAGTATIGALMVIICADILFRNILGSSLPLASELGALALVMIVYLQLATTIRHDRLVRADILLGALAVSAPRAARLLGAVFNAVGAVTIAILAWATIEVLQRDISYGEFIGVTGVAVLPVWPFRAAIFLGITVAAVQFAFETVRALRGRDGAA